MSARAVLTGGAVLLAGCAAKPLPPVVRYAPTQACAQVPDIGGAIRLGPGKKSGETLSTPVTADTPCLAGGSDFSTPYIVYALPSAIDNRVVEVGGMLEPQRSFPATVATLDAAGKRVRTFASELYLIRSDRYSVQFAPRADERYVLVTVDPALVGISYDRVETGVNTTYIGTAYGAISWRSGADNMVSRSYSYEGTVLATVFDKTEK
ncbi:hypothetical protein [Stakelama tenebrarum]|uniref:Lipoprotein n=1 Tax=Stakelama tenebrarum TaxID=2711215 RepID=A0A6G6Y3R7_9SPHN|nr:hypothetical protein [Sphingosinithalassobacter tenebrarum]QIG79572.1 hypothetical protein G5C33_07050 [Sphingosinithalassobacter tenebrarum]